MSDAALRRARPDAQAHALACMRAGEPFDARLLVTLTPDLDEAEPGGLSIAQAHAAFVREQWLPPRCETCGGDGGSVRATCNEILETCTDPCDGPTSPTGLVVCGHCQVAWGPPCPACMGTGRQWSEKHAELAAYALGYLPGVPNACRLDTPWPPGFLAEWLQELSDFGTLPPLAAALGAARAWAEAHDDRGDYLAENNFAALAAVERYLYSPTKANREVHDRHRGSSPVALLLGACLLRRHASDAVYFTLVRGLPEKAAADAARREVRRWVLRVFRDGGP